MDTRIHHVAPAELPDAIDPTETTLVLGAPSIGKSHHLDGVGPTVDSLDAVNAVNAGECVIVDDFVAAALDVDPNEYSPYAPVIERDGGAVLVTRPRSFDWLGTHRRTIRTNDVDAVLVIRHPPHAGADAIDDIHAALGDTTWKRYAKYDEHRAEIERHTYPPYEYGVDSLRSELGWYDPTVTPAQLLPAAVAAHDDIPVVFDADLRGALGDARRVADLSGFVEDVRFVFDDCRPEGGFPSALPSRYAASLHAAMALRAVATGTTADADTGAASERDAEADAGRHRGGTHWLAPVLDARLLPVAEETFEAVLELPPGTISCLRLLEADGAGAAFEAVLASDAFDEETFASACEDHGDALAAARDACEALASAATAPEEYRVARLPAPSWFWDGIDELDAATADRQLPGQSVPETLSVERALDASIDDVFAALDGGVVLLSGPSGVGKRAVAAQLAHELDGWGATVRVSDLNQPDRERPGIAASDRAIVVTTYADEPGRIVTLPAVEALCEWVDDGVCTGALVVCDDGNRERFDSVCEEAGSGDSAAWTSRTEYEVTDTLEAGDPGTPEEVADAVLDAVGWGERDYPYSDVDVPAGRSLVATVAGTADHALDGPFVGRVLAAVVDRIDETHQPELAHDWLTHVDTLLGRVGDERAETRDGTVEFLAEVYGTALATVAVDDPRDDSWLAPLVQLAVNTTGHTRSLGPTDPIGGELAPLDDAFGIALASLLLPDEPPADDPATDVGGGADDAAPGAEVPWSPDDSLGENTVSLGDVDWGDPDLDLEEVAWGADSMESDVAEWPGANDGTGEWSDNDGTGDAGDDWSDLDDGDDSSVGAGAGVGGRAAGDPSGPSPEEQAALALVDSVLQYAADYSGLTGPTVLRGEVYANATGRLVEASSDPAGVAAAFDALGELIRQTGTDQQFIAPAYFFGNCYGAVLGMVANSGLADDEIPAWVDAVVAQATDAIAAFVAPQDARHAYHELFGNAASLWVFEFGSTVEEIGPWLDAVGDAMVRAFESDALADEGLETLRLWYGHVFHRFADLWTTEYGANDDTEGALAAYVALGARIAAALDVDALDEADFGYDGVVVPPVGTVGTVGAPAPGSSTAALVDLYAGAFAEYGFAERDDDIPTRAHGSAGGMYDPPTVEDWVGALDDALRTAESAGTIPLVDDEAAFLAAVYRGALGGLLSRGPATHSRYDVMPRREVEWFAAMNERVRAAATDGTLGVEPFAFGSSVYGAAAVEWAARAEPQRADDWIEALRTADRSLLDALPTADTDELAAAGMLGRWFGPRAATTGQVLAALVARDDDGMQSQVHLVEDVRAYVWADATAPENPLGARDHLVAVFASMFAAATWTAPDELRFAVSRTATLLDDALYEWGDDESLAWTEDERVPIVADVYGTALAVTGRSAPPLRSHPGGEGFRGSDALGSGDALGSNGPAQSWVATFESQVGATARERRPDDPASFVREVYTLAHRAVADDSERRRTLDASLERVANGYEDAVPLVAAVAEAVDGSATARTDERETNGPLGPGRTVDGSAPDDLPAEETAGGAESGTPGEQRDEDGAGPDRGVDRTDDVDD